MASRHQRTTNAHRAAVCALVLVGVPYMKACRIVGVPYRALHSVLGRDWWGRQACRPKVWRGEKLMAVRSAYLSTMPMKDIERGYGISRRHLVTLAHKHGWRIRARGKGAALPKALLKLSDADRSRYTKLRRILGRSAAEQAVFGI
jgi:hypothetical protein